MKSLPIQFFRRQIINLPFASLTMSLLSLLIKNNANLLAASPAQLRLALVKSAYIYHTQYLDHDFGPG